MMYWQYDLRLVFEAVKAVKAVGWAAGWGWTEVVVSL